jgi:hypothetical protein
MHRDAGGEWGVKAVLVQPCRNSVTFNFMSLIFKTYEQRVIDLPRQALGTDIMKRLKKNERRCRTLWSAGNRLGPVEA